MSGKGKRRLHKREHCRERKKDKEAVLLGEIYRDQEELGWGEVIPW